MSASSYREALQSFLEDTVIPAYLNYQLPQTPPTFGEFPYITYTVNIPEGCNTVNQSFTAWFYNGPGADAAQDRANFQDLIQQAIPPEGLSLKYGENGRADIYRGGVSWMRDFQDYVEKNIIGVKVTLFIRIFE